MLVQEDAGRRQLHQDEDLGLNGFSPASKQICVSSCLISSCFFQIYFDFCGPNQALNKLSCMKFAGSVSACSLVNFLEVMD